MSLFYRTIVLGSISNLTKFNIFTKALFIKYTSKYHMTGSQ